MIKFVDMDIEQKIGESSQAIAKFEDDLSLKLIKMAKEANEALKIQEMVAANKLQEMQQEINREESIQTYMVNKAMNQEEEKDAEVKQYEDKLKNLMQEFKVIQIDDRESELMKLSHTQSFQKIKTDKQIYEQYSSQAITPKGQSMDTSYLRDRFNSVNKSTLYSNRNNYDDMQGWISKEDNQKFCSVVNSSHDLSQNQLNINTQLGFSKQSTQKTSQFSQKLQKKVDNNESEENNGQRQNTLTNTKLYIAFPEEQIENPEYLKYDLKTRFRMQMYRIGECFLVIIMVVILFMLYQFYFK